LDKFVVYCVSPAEPLFLVTSFFPPTPSSPLLSREETSRLREFFAFSPFSLFFSLFFEIFESVGQSNLGLPSPLPVLSPHSPHHSAFKDDSSSRCDRGHCRDTPLLTVQRVRQTTAFERGERRANPSPPPFFRLFFFFKQGLCFLSFLFGHRFSVWGIANSPALRLSRLKFFLVSLPTPGFFDCPTRLVLFPDPSRDS